VRGRQRRKPTLRYRRGSPRGRRLRYATGGVRSGDGVLGHAVLRGGVLGPVGVGGGILGLVTVGAAGDGFISAGGGVVSDGVLRRGVVRDGVLRRGIRRFDRVGGGTRGVTGLTALCGGARLTGCLRDSGTFGARVPFAVLRDLTLIRPLALGRCLAGLGRNDIGGLLTGTGTATGIRTGIPIGTGTVTGHGLTRSSGRILGHGHGGAPGPLGLSLRRRAQLGVDATRITTGTCTGARTATRARVGVTAPGGRIPLLRSRTRDVPLQRGGGDPHGRAALDVPEVPAVPAVPEVPVAGVGLLGRGGKRRPGRRKGTTRSRAGQVDGRTDRRRGRRRRGPGGRGGVPRTRTGFRTAPSRRGVLRVPGRRRVVDGELARRLDGGLRVGLVIAGCGPAPAHPVPIAVHNSSWCGRHPQSRVPGPTVLVVRAMSS
ncbi:hypothetical protein STRIP9103_07225, partial [Streptomyces ipomoeae 91-03]